MSYCDEVLSESINTFISSCKKMTDFINNEIDIKCYKMTEPILVDNELKCNNITPCIYSNNDTPTNKTICAITDIELTNSSIKYIGSKQLIEMSKQNTPLFNELKSKYFKPKTDRVYDIKQVCYYIAHNIRNSETNKYNNLKRRVNRIKRNPLLFDLDKLNNLLSEQNKQLA